MLMSSSSDKKVVLCCSDLQAHCEKLTASGSFGPPINSSYSIHKKTGKRYPLYLDEFIAANNEFKVKDQGTSLFCEDTPTTSSPMKGFTVVGSRGSVQDDLSTNNDFLTGYLVDDWNVSNDSCSKT